MTHSNGNHVEAATHDAAVIGVVIAGVLVSFTIPGPFDWGASLIGAILLLVLVAYASWPKGTDKASLRRAIGLAVSTAFCLLLIFGRPFDVVVGGSGEDAHRLLSGWPDPSIKRDDDEPDPNAGLALIVLWTILFALVLLGWYLIERRKQ